MEKVCAICGSSFNLKAAINGREIILACPKCIEMEELIVTKRPSEEQLSYANKPYTVRERLARAMGSREKKEEKPSPIVSSPSSLYCISPYRKTELPIKLVENFHWKIMMARKAKKISQDLLARQIGEDITVIKTIEPGCITRDSERIIKKIESALGINLKEEKTIQTQIPSQSPKQEQIEQSGKVLVTRENIRTLKVADLIKVREEIKAKKEQVLHDREMPEEIESEPEIIDLEG